jgi:vitamin B12 transporter
MEKIKFTLGSLLMLLISTFAMAQEEGQARDLGRVVVSGNRFQTPIEKSGRIIYKVTAAEIEKTAGRTVADILNTMPGINIDGAYGTPGTNLSYNIRGGRNRQTLILIDGLPINDPSSIDSDYDLRLINAKDIEYIEVLKGGASALYGTNAAAGVINIKLKESKSETPQVTLGQEVGSFQSLNTNASVQGKAGKLNYLAGGSFSLSEGISAAESADPAIEFQNDGFYRYTGRTKLSYEFSDQFSLGGNLSYEKFLSDYDGGAFFDADNQFDIRQVSFGLNPKWNYEGGNLQLKLNYNRVRREFISAFPSTFKGENIQADLSNSYTFGDKIKTIVGVQVQGFSAVSGDDNGSQTNVDPYAHLSWDIIGGLTLNGGLRLNNNSEYGSNFVYSVNPSYLFNLSEDNQLKLFASYSTAFVSPSIYQLYSLLYGNANLTPEESESLDFGLSLYLSSKLVLNAEYFDRQEDNAIGFRSDFDDQGNFIGGQYINIVGTREISGIEMDVTYQPNEQLKFTASFSDYQFGDPTQFYRIPSQKFGATAQYTLSTGTNLGLIYNQFGERQVSTFTDPFVETLESYGVLDFTISHELFDGDLIFNGAIYNLLDEDFVGVYGFSTRPVNFMIGLTAQF